MMDPSAPIDALTRLERWIDEVDALLARAEIAVGMARAEDAPLVERIRLFVDIVALRTRLAAERAALGH